MKNRRTTFCLSCLKIKKAMSQFLKILSLQQDLDGLIQKSHLKSHPPIFQTFLGLESHLKIPLSTEKERLGKSEPLSLFCKSPRYIRISYLLKYLFKSPSKALPCRASSFAISWTVS